MYAVLRGPSPQLAPFVSRLWYVEGRDFDHARERVLPGTTLQLLINLHEDELRWWGDESFSAGHRTRGAAVGGLYLEPFAIDTLEQQRVLGAVFRPGAAAAVLGVPADALTGTHTALESLWGADAARLRERLLGAARPDQALSILDSSLVERIVGPLDPVASYACRALDRGVRVAAIARDVGLGPKRLRERFSAAVGVTPKSYARLARLQHLLVAAAAPRRPDWAELALRCGYYDQAHLIQEFRSLTGLTPTAYRPREQDDHNHVVLPP
jgi:AraC-like DNA-binding protein